MSTTWSSVINTDEPPVTIGLENGNYTFDGVGPGDAVAPTAPVGGVAFEGFIATDETFNFGSSDEFGIGYTSYGPSMNFIATTINANTDVLFNFKASGEDLMSIYKGGAVKIKNLGSDPTDAESHVYGPGSLIFVNGDLKILQ